MHIPSLLLAALAAVPVLADFSPQFTLPKAGSAVNISEPITIAWRKPTIPTADDGFPYHYHTLTLEAHYKMPHPNESVETGNSLGGTIVIFGNHTLTEAGEITWDPSEVRDANLEYNGDDEAKLARATLSFRLAMLAEFHDPFFMAWTEEFTLRGLTSAAAVARPAWFGLAACLAAAVMML